MYIVNTTFVVSPSVHDNWYSFFTEKFLPSLEQNKMYGSIRFTRVLSDQIEQHLTYSLQIDCADMAVYQNYIGVSLHEYSEFASSLFDTEVVHFVSLLKIINDIKK